MSHPTALIRQHPHCPVSDCLTMLMEPEPLPAGHTGWIQTTCPRCETVVKARFWTHQPIDILEQMETTPMV